jgi:hypothetical protein
MKSIRIIKRAQASDGDKATVEDKKLVEHASRSVAETVKSWIAETEQRKRAQRHSLATLGLVVLMAVTAGFGQATACWSHDRVEQDKLRSGR